MNISFINSLVSEFFFKLFFHFIVLHNYLKIAVVYQQFKQ